MSIASVQEATWMDVLVVVPAENLRVDNYWHSGYVPIGSPTPEIRPDQFSLANSYITNRRINAMENIFQWIGIVVAVLLLLYIFLFLVNIMVKPKADPVAPSDAMPNLRPLPIPTKNKSYWRRVLAWIFDIRRWELTQDWYFQFKDDEGKDLRIALHKGFIFDGASIPRPLWALLSPVGLLLLPGLIHDYGYNYDQLWQVVDEEVFPYKYKAGREYWDDLFIKIGQEVNGFAIINYVAWLGIKLGGSRAFKEYREKEEKPAKPN